MKRMHNYQLIDKSGGLSTAERDSNTWGMTASVFLSSLLISFMKEIRQLITEG